MKTYSVRKVIRSCGRAEDKNLVIAIYDIIKILHLQIKVPCL